MPASNRAVLASLFKNSTAALRLVMGAFLALCSLLLLAAPATAQTVTASSVTPSTYSGAGQTLTFSFTVNSGTRQVTGASVTSGIGVAYSCAIPPDAGTNTNITFTCTGTYVTTAADTVQVLESATININSAGVPLGLPNNVLIATYVAPPAPTVTAVSPATGPGAGGTSVTITGTNFTGATAVSFGSTPATSFSVSSATSITATSPAGTGTVNVRVTNGGGTSATGSGNAFVYASANVAPSITTNPAAQTVTAGNTASFTAAATGTPTPTVQWQQSTDGGGSFANISGATSTTLSFTALAAQNGHQFRAVFTNSAGTATTTAATLTVNSPPVITTQPVGATVVPGTAITLSAAATGTPTPTVQWSISENGGASWLPISTSPSFSVISPTARTLLARAVFTNAAGSATSDSVTLAWVKQDQTISFTTTAPSAAVVGGTTYTVGATATSGLGVGFTIDPSASSVCSVSGTTVSFIGIGTCTINANQAGNTAYNAAPQVQQSFAVGQGANVITFPALSDTAFTAAPPTLAATASSGLTVSYASNSTGVCTVAGGAISFVASGTCSITASQAGDANYVAASPVTRTFAVTPGVNTITFPALSDTALTSPAPALSATASSGLTVSYASNSSGVCTVAGSTITLVATGTCSITASQDGNSTFAAATSVTRTFAVTPGVNVITFPALPDTAFTSTPPTLGAAASSNLAVSYASNSAAICTVSGNVISFVATGTCSVTASQDGNANFAAATPVTQTFAVTPGINSITFAALPNRALASGSFTLNATASSGLAVTFTTSTPTICTISASTVNLVALGTCTVLADQAGNANFSAASQVSQSFTVTQAVTTVGLTSSVSTVFFGQPVTLTATVNGVAPTGSVRFNDGITVLGTSALTNGTASFTTSTLGAGSHALTATYLGDATNLPSTSSVINVTVTTRPDPSQDPDTRSSVDSQFRTAERFVRTQIDNVGDRLSDLHSDAGSQDNMEIRLTQTRRQLRNGVPGNGIGSQSGAAGYGYPVGQTVSGSEATMAALNPDAPWLPGAPLGMVPAAMGGGSGQVSDGTQRAAGDSLERRAFRIWASGDVNFGKERPNGAIEQRFTSTGITVGIDGDFSANLKLGAAFGFAWDHTRIGTNGSENMANNASLTFYGSWRAAPKLFIDGLVGMGYGTIDTTRFSTTGTVFLDGKRRTGQTFAALIGTYEAKLGEIEFAPYLRADGIWVHLSPYTETGSPYWALAFQEADENSFSGTVGAKSRFPLDKDGKWKLSAKAEYRTRISGDYTQLLDYADIQGAQGTPYAITGQGVNSSTFTGGLGIEGKLHRLMLRLNYDLTTLAGGNVSNGISGAVAVKF